MYTRMRLLHHFMKAVDSVQNLGHTPIPRIGHEFAQRGTCLHGESDQISNCAVRMWKLSAGAMYTFAPLHTKIVESWTAREAVSEVAECAGTRKTCNFSSSMPSWASIWAGIMTVPCKPPPPDKSRVNVGTVDLEIQSTRADNTRREANVRDDGKGVGETMDPCAVQNRKNHTMQPSTDDKCRTTHSNAMRAGRACRVMM